MLRFFIPMVPRQSTTFDDDTAFPCLSGPRGTSMNGMVAVPVSRQVCTNPTSIS